MKATKLQMEHKLALAKMRSLALESRLCRDFWRSPNVAEVRIEDAIHYRDEARYLKDLETNK